MHHLGKNLRFLRRNAGRTQAQLAEVIGKKQTTIGNWENSISEPNIEELLLLGQYFDTSVDILLKIDLSQTNWRTSDNPDTHESTPGEYETQDAPVHLVREDPFTYIIGEIKTIRQELDELKTISEKYEEIKSIREDLEELKKRLQ